MHGPPDGREIYLTFDDGPDPDWTPRVLDALAAAGARATFFVIGQAARRFPHLVRRAVAEGHVIGNHTWSHRHPWLLAPSEARREVRDGAAAVADVVGRETTLFRPPHGRLRRCMVEEAEQQGEAVVLWNRSGVDWGWMGRASGIRRRLGHVSAGDVVLLHDGRRSINRPDVMTRVLPDLIREFRGLGLLPVALNRMLAA